MNLTLYNGLYQVKEIISQGGFATIYLVTSNENPSSDLVMKVSNNPFDPAYAKSIREESRLIRKFNHPNIVRLIPIPKSNRGDIYVARAVELPGNPPFFVMEYLTGGTLGNYLEIVNKVTYHEAAAIGLEIARALDHIHQKGYAHNDMKLENVVFRNPVKVGNPFEPVLIDFGIATRVLPPVAGTMYIKAPEQINKSIVDESSTIDGTKVDVWGLGIILYRMLSGELPFKDRNLSTTIRNAHQRQLEMPIPFP